MDTLPSLHTSLFLLATIAMIGVGRAESFQEKSDGCTTYQAQLRSMPDLTHRTMHQGRRHAELDIVDVTSTNYQRSFYWCQLDVQQSDSSLKRYRRFGFNSSHWWVEMGCGGWFLVTECPTKLGGAERKLGVSQTDQGKEGVKSSMASGQITQLSSSGRSTLIDDLYRDWPQLGYHFPASSQMWDVLDNATHVNVAEQLGFHNHSRKTRSTLFDD